jgi:DNA-binding MarR family transcriptional regulator
MAQPKPAAPDALRLDRQLCFPIYAASRLVTRLYQPLLEPLGLTYPQYIILMILWEDAPCAVSAIGARALLSSNTLTPLLKRLEQGGWITRARSARDERVVLTAEGRALKGRCACIPGDLVRTVGYPAQDLMTLKALMDDLVAHLRTLDAAGRA